MDERRTRSRERVMFGATASTSSGATRPCVVRNLSDGGARVTFGSDLRLPDDIALTIARKGRSYKARVVWWRDNAAGLAFVADAPSITPDTDLADRLKAAEKNNRLLKLRVRELSGG